jgi:formylglycine-generating enzyme required for sulfatase activity
MNRPHLTTTIAAATILVFAALTNTASATVTFDWATVGNAGNAADQTTGRGAVDYEYRISKYEVTNAQYAEFLNAVAASDPNKLYNQRMGFERWAGITRSGLSGSFTYATKANMDKKPVNYVSFFDSMRFTNWLHNGQGAGGTEVVPVHANRRERVH